MQEDQKLRIINRIITGVIYLDIGGELYKSELPTYDDISLSELFYDNIITDAKYAGLMTMEEAKLLRQRRQIWTNLDEEQEKKLNEQLETLKIHLYEAQFHPKKQKSLRRSIQQIRRTLEQMYLRKTQYDSMTLEYFAERERQDFLIALSIRDSRGRRVYTYDNFRSKDAYVLKRFVDAHNSFDFDPAKLREIARTEPFRSMWSYDKNRIFYRKNGPPTLAQIYLSMYSRMYDSVYEHPETPSEQVINDDDMLDGWFAKQRREREAERKKREAETIFDRKKGGRHAKKDGRGELFIMAESKEEAEQIMSLNTIHARQVMKQREHFIKERGGRANEEELPDSQLMIQQKAIEGFKQHYGK